MNSWGGSPEVQEQQPWKVQQEVESGGKIFCDKLIATTYQEDCYILEKRKLHLKERIEGKEVKLNIKEIIEEGEPGLVECWGGDRWGMGKVKGRVMMDRRGVG